MGEVVNLLDTSIFAAVKACPAVLPLLTGRARWLGIMATRKDAPDAIKTEAQYLKVLTNAVEDLYAGDIEKGEFLDRLDAVMSRQIFLAHLEAWKETGGDKNNLPDYLQESADDMILREYDFADQFAKDIIDARIDKTPIDPLLARAELWANRYNDAYNMALIEIRTQQEGETGKPVNLAWGLGQTEEHCDICSTLDGVIASASTWKEAGIFPQSGESGTLPNPALVSHTEDQKGCGGWRCDCKLSDTDESATINTAQELRNLIGWISEKSMFLKYSDDQPRDENGRWTSGLSFALEKANDPSFYDADIENVIIYSSDGKEIASSVGGDTGADLSHIPASAGKDAHLVHNHPAMDLEGQTWTFSDKDIEMATDADMASITATGKYSTYTIERPSSGWKDYKQSIEETRASLKWSDRYLLETLRYRDEEAGFRTPNSISNRDSRKFWKKYAEITGATYTETKRKKQK